MPWRRFAAQAGVDARGQRSEVFFGLGERGFGRRAVPVAALRRPAATASKSPSRGPALADGIRPLPELPQATSSRRRGEREQRRRAAPPARVARRPVACTPSRRMSLTVLQALGERVRQARRADRGGGAGDVVGGRGGRWRPCRRGRAAARRRGRRRRAAGPTLPGFSSHSPSPRSSTVAVARAARPSPARPRGARTRAPRGSGRSGRCGCGCASRQSSASSVESTYSHTGSRGLAW